MLFDDEFMGPLVGALAGTSTVDPLDDFEPTMDPWEDKGWLLAGRMEKQRDPLRRLVTGFKDDGDPAHEQADQRALAIGVDVYKGDADLLTIARSQIGAPYIWNDVNPVGAAGGPGAGFDCSGFTQWVLSRFGIQTPHLSSAQQAQFKAVGREDLQPGDLVFYHYSDRNGPGDTADHVEIYIGNGQTIGSSGGGVMVRSVNWDAFVGGGATGIEASGETVTPRRHRQRQEPTPLEDLMSVPMNLTGSYSSVGLPTGTGLPAAVTDLLMPEKLPGTRRTFGGPRGAIEKQIYKGFMDAGRPDLAKMVGTPAFTAWIRAESGWTVDSVSTYYPNHGRNMGLFQFWEGHPWTGNYMQGGEWTATAYEQAKLVARYFPSLSPGDIRRYAEEIRRGEYHGWP